MVFKWHSPEILENYGLSKNDKFQRRATGQFALDRGNMGHRKSFFFAGQVGDLMLFRFIEVSKHNSRPDVVLASYTSCTEKNTLMSVRPNCIPWNSPKGVDKGVELKYTPVHSMGVSGVSTCQLTPLELLYMSASNPLRVFLGYLGGVFRLKCIPWDSRRVSHWRVSTPSSVN